MHNNMNKDKIKKLINKVILEESKKDNIDVDINIFSIIEYYKSPIFKEKLKLNKNSIFKPLTCLGYKSSDNSLVLFTTPYSKMYSILIQNDIKNENQLFNILSTTYHEYRHLLQSKKIYKNIDLSIPNNLLEINNNISYDEFKYIIDNFNMRYVYYNDGKSDYRLFHDFYSFEIDADCYSFEKTENYLKENDSYNNYKDIIHLHKIYNNICKTLYDIQVSLTKFLYILSISNINVLPYENTIIELLFEKDLKDNKFIFRNINEILENEKFQNLDEKIKYSILSNNLLIKNIDIDRLNDEECHLYFKSLKYTYELDEKRKRELSKYSLDSNKNICKYFLKDISLFMKYKKELLGNYYENLNSIFENIEDSKTKKLRKHQKNL